MAKSLEEPAKGARAKLGQYGGRILQQHRWLVYVLPFAVFSVTGVCEPSPQPDNVAIERSEATAAGGKDSANLDSETSGTVKPVLWYQSYPFFYTLRMALTALAIVAVWPYWRAIPWQCSRWAWVAGVVGVIVWVGVCRLGIERTLAEAFGVGHWFAAAGRPSFDPYQAFDSRPMLMATFLAVRLAGLGLIVPLMEEFFLRGFLMRFVQKPDWWTIPIGTVTLFAAVAATAYGIVAHPVEPIAAALWFSGITLLYAKTRSIWDCVVAHSVTNTLLGLYILAFRDWTLW